MDKNDKYHVLKQALVYNETATVKFLLLHIDVETGMTEESQV